MEEGLCSNAPASRTLNILWIYAGVNPCIYMHTVKENRVNAETVSSSSFFEQPSRALLRWSRTLVAQKGSRCTEPGEANRTERWVNRAGLWGSVQSPHASRAEHWNTEQSSQFTEQGSESTELDPGNRTVPWAHRVGPWAHRTGPWAHRTRPWDHRTGPWVHRTGPWGYRTEPWAHRTRPWAHRTELWAHRTGF